VGLFPQPWLYLLGEKGRPGSPGAFSLNLVVKQALCREAFTVYNSSCKLSVIQCISWKIAGKKRSFLGSDFCESDVMILTATSPTVKKTSGIGSNLLTGTAGRKLSAFIPRYL
jgi:hypothetical protein